MRVAFGRPAPLRADFRKNLSNLRDDDDALISESPAIIETGSVYVVHPLLKGVWLRGSFGTSPSSSYS
jgi:hypothetical protein